MIPPEKRRLAIRFALLQLADAGANVLIPRRYIQAHLDKLGVPRWLQPMLAPLKVLGSSGLFLGLRWPELGVLTSACLVGYYATATGFHLTTREHPAFAAPAATFGAGAVALLIGIYLPEARSSPPSGDAQ